MSVNIAIMDVRRAAETRARSERGLAWSASSLGLSGESRTGDRDEG